MYAELGKVSLTLAKKVKLRPQDRLHKMAFWGIWLKYNSLVDENPEITFKHRIIKISKIL